MVDYQVVAELVGDPDGGGDVVGAMAVLAPGNLPPQYHAQRLKLQVAIDRLALAFRLPLLGVEPLQVVSRVDKGTADHRSRAEARARRLLFLSVHALRVLAEGRL